MENDIKKHKNLWKVFNPSLREIENNHPNISILGLWWAWYWRLFALVLVVCFIFTFVAFIFSLFTRS